MSNDVSRERVAIAIGKPEALILFEMLAEFYSQPALEIRDNAERLALVRLHGCLQSSLTEPFSKDYAKLVREARDMLLREWGSPSE